MELIISHVSSGNSQDGGTFHAILSSVNLCFVWSYHTSANLLHVQAPKFLKSWFSSASYTHVADMIQLIRHFKILECNYLLLICSSGQCILQSIRCSCTLVPSVWHMHKTLQSETAAGRPAHSSSPVKTRM